MKLNRELKKLKKLARLGSLGKLKDNSSCSQIRGLNVHRIQRYRYFHFNFHFNFRKLSIICIVTL